MTARLRLPTRDVLAKVSDGNQRMIRWFEEIDASVGVAGNDASLDRANHIGTQVAATISDFQTASYLVTQSQLVAGSNINIVYDDLAETITIASAGGSATWGAITGTLSDQADLQAALNAAGGSQALAWVI
jgi:hypothetical protein